MSTLFLTGRPKWQQRRLGLLPVAGTARGKSAGFQASLAALRNGRSFQEFVNAIKAKTGIVFSRSYLKRVEDGDLAPNPLLLYALDVLSGHEPVGLLAKYAIEAAGNDLIRHGRTGQQAAPQKGAADVPAEARIRELEGRLEQFEQLVPEIQRVLVRLTNLAAGEEVSSARTTSTKGRGSHRKVG